MEKKSSNTVRASARQCRAGPKHQKRRRRVIGRWPQRPQALDSDRGLDALAIERQLADSHAGRIGDRIGERRRGRALRRFAGAEERRAGAVDDVHVDAVRHVGKAQDRIACSSRGW